MTVKVTNHVISLNRYALFFSNFRPILVVVHKQSLTPQVFFVEEAPDVGSPAAIKLQNKKKKCAKCLSKKHVDDLRYQVWGKKRKADKRCSKQQEKDFVIK